MRTTSLTGAFAPGIFPLIILALSGVPAAAQDTTSVIIKPSPQSGAPANLSNWSWAELVVEPEPEDAGETPSYLSTATTAGNTARVPAGTGLNTRVSKVANANGTTSVTAAGSFKDWTWTEFGVDMSLTTAQRSAILPYQTSTVTGMDGSGAVAWAHTTLPGVSNFMLWEQGSVDVRVNPQDQSTLATTFSRQWALSDSLTASLSDNYALVVQAGGAEQWQTGKTMSLSLAQSGTSVSVGTATNSLDRAWLPSLSASQKLIGPVVVTTTVADNGDTINKSITAGFRRTW